MRDVNDIEWHQGDVKQHQAMTRKCWGILGKKIWVMMREARCCNPTLGLSVRRQFTLPKVGKWSPPGLSKTQKTIWSKSLHLAAFFILMQSSWSINVQNGLALPIWTSPAQVMGKRRAKSQTNSLTPDH